jgi:hypothetical protein
VAADASRCDNISGWAVGRSQAGFGIAPDPDACWCLPHALMVASILTGKIASGALPDEPDTVRQAAA